MRIVRRLDVKDHPWLISGPLTRLTGILNHDGVNARMVGGCVRDALLGRDITDIDLACSLPPEEAMRRLENAGIKVIPVGIRHGTIMAVIGGNHFEITSLRRDVKTDGRHAKVAFIDDWTEDARRRDFTINALYLDQDGSLYDPCSGLKDIAARRVRFIGEAAARIKEDALRILRFFRFAARIGQGKLDGDGLQACIRYRDMIDSLSGERLAQELFKILGAENLLPVMNIMADEGILARIVAGHKSLTDFIRYVRLENALGRCDILARLSCLVRETAVDQTVRRLKLSRKQAAKLMIYCRHDVIMEPDCREKFLRRMLYRYGREAVVFALLCCRAQGKIDDQPFRHMLDHAESWTIPDFPLTGQDLIGAGVEPGPSMGNSLRRLEELWIESDFTLGKDQLTGQI